MMTKTARILSHFLAGLSINTFEAERLGDHSVNSTVSTLANDYGLTFIRTWEQVPNRFGGKTRVVRYRLPPFEFKRALKVFDLMMKRSRK